MADVDATHLMLARKRVRAGRNIVAVQRDLIGFLQSVGRSTVQEGGILRSFEESLAIFEDDLRQLEGKA